MLECMLCILQIGPILKLELENRELRVPITKDKKLFGKVIEIGKYLIWLHTYGKIFFNNKERVENKTPIGIAKTKKGVTIDNYPNSYSYDEQSQSINVGNGIYGPVTKEVWEFEISGYKVVKKWLGYRMKTRKGRKSSPLDEIVPDRWDYDKEFLKLLWVLEKTVELYPKQKVLFEKVLDSALYSEDDFQFEEIKLKPKSKRKQKHHSDQMELPENINGTDQNAV